MRCNRVVAEGSQDAQLEGLFGYMPTIRAELIAHAKARDIALGDKVQKLPNGPYESAIMHSLGELPAELQGLCEFCMPVNKQWEPTDTKHEHGEEQLGEATSELTGDVKKWFDWAEQALSHEKGTTQLEERQWATNCVVSWCMHMQELKWQQSEVDNEEFQNKRAKIDHAAYKDAMNSDKAHIQRHCEKYYKHYHTISQKYAQLMKEKNAETMQAADNYNNDREAVKDKLAEGTDEDAAKKESKGSSSAD